MRTLQVAVAVSGVGHVVHNVEEFGFGTVFVSQTMLPAAVTVLLFVLARRPTRRYLRATAIWALIVIVGGGGSVFPLSVLPFVPAQTVSHYAAHAAYAVLQVPLLMTAWRCLRTSDPERAERVPSTGAAPQ